MSEEPSARSVIQRAIDRALVRKKEPVARDDRAAIAELLRQRDPAGDGDVRRDDRIAPNKANTGIGQVHGAALAVTESVRLAQNLGHHALGVAALGNAHAVTAVRRQYRVAGA